MFNRKESHKFFDDAAQFAADMSAQNNPSENALMLAFPMLVGMMIEAHAADDATKFRRALVMLAAHAALAEQLTQPEECECEDCTAHAAATLRAEQETINGLAAIEKEVKSFVSDLTLRDFWWTRIENEHAPLGAMIVTQSRSSYPMVSLSAWHPIRAEHYGSACVKAAAEYHATHTKG